MLTLIALSAVLMQDPPAPPPPPEMRSHFIFMGAGGDGPGNIDADGDGQVTREEFAAPLNDAFAKMDKDGDGRLSREELASDHGPGAGNFTFRRPRDGGEGVEHFEFRRSSGGGEGRARVERDGARTMVFVGPDGRGDEPHVVVRTLSDDGPGVVRLRRGSGGEPGGRVEVRTVVNGAGDGSDDLDKDGDGKISEAEFTAPLREAFARMDADRSGFVETGERGGENQVHVFTRRTASADGE
jgi:hypothetical protein